jgi:tetratricopeptide (TPR) repeat protein
MLNSNEVHFFAMSGPPTDKELLLRRSDILIADGSYEKALLFLDRILEEDPENETALSMKGLACCLMGYTEKGISIFEEALEMCPFSKILLINFADACLRSSLPGRSLEILERAISHYPDDDGLLMLKEIIITARDRRYMLSSLN